MADDMGSDCSVTLLFVTVSTSVTSVTAFTLDFLRGIAPSSVGALVETVNDRAAAGCSLGGKVRFTPCCLGGLIIFSSRLVLVLADVSRTHRCLDFVLSIWYELHMGDHLLSSTTALMGR